jgi:catechol 2,3-dioxygenase-like lactoylglutathione lyase family enzyme
MEDPARVGDETAPATRVFAITLFTDDLAAARSFYQTAFAMPIVHEDASSVAFAFPNLVVNLVEAAGASELIEPAPVGGPGTPSRMLLTLQVGDVDAACERLQAQGVTLLNGPITRPWGPRTAALADPSGHCWELSD